MIWKAQVQKSPIPWNIAVTIAWLYSKGIKLSHARIFLAMGFHHIGFSLGLAKFLDPGHGGSRNPFIPFQGRFKKRLSITELFMHISRAGVAHRQNWHR